MICVVFDVYILLASLAKVVSLEAIETALRSRCRIDDGMDLWREGLVLPAIYTVSPAMDSYN